MKTPALERLAREAAEQHGVPPMLLLHVPEVESNWQPWASRYEPAFNRYLAPSFPIATTIRTETEHQRTSWGLCQIMGWTARTLGYSGPIPQLCDPATNLNLGALYLRRLHDKALAEDGTPAPSWRWAVTAYNHGEGWRGIDPHWGRIGYTAKYQSILLALGEP